GVSLEAARADLADVSRSLMNRYADWHDTTSGMAPMPLRASIVGRAEGRIGLFGGGVLLVLLVAIANVATLMLVRAAARGPEIGMRVTLGATRARLARLVIAESAVLMVLVFLLATPLAALALRLVGTIAPGLPRASEIAMDARTLVFIAAA